MNDDQIQQNEELMILRDEIIEKLQGEWCVDTCWKSIALKALRLGVYIWFLGMIFLLIFFLIMYGIHKAKGTLNMQISILEFFGIMALFMLGMGIIGSCCVMIQCLWNKNGPAIVIDGNELVRDRGKGFVPETLDLFALKSVTDLISTGYGASGIIRMMGSSVTMYSKHILVSEQDHNTPRITPAVYENGRELLNHLKDIAKLNQSIRDAE